MFRPVLFAAAVLTGIGSAGVPGHGPTGGVAATAQLERSRGLPPASAIDPVLEWNQIFNDTTLRSLPTPSSVVPSRAAALVATATFDAVNGIDRRYRPF